MEVLKRLVQPCAAVTQPSINRPIIWQGATIAGPVAAHTVPSHQSGKQMCVTCVEINAVTMHCGKPPPLNNHHFTMIWPQVVSECSISQHALSTMERSADAQLGQNLLPLELPPFAWQKYHVRRMHIHHGSHRLLVSSVHPCCLRLCYLMAEPQCSSGVKCENAQVWQFSECSCPLLVRSWHERAPGLASNALKCCRCGQI